MLPLTSRISRLFAYILILFLSCAGPDGEIEDRLRAEHTIVESAMDAEVLSYIEDHLALQTDELKSLRFGRQ